MTEFGPALSAGGWRAVLAPGVGGGIAALTLEGADILRPAPAGATEPTQMGCFPIAPYVGRTDNGAFRFLGHLHRLPPNFPFAHPHSLHGPSWQSPWRVETSTDDAATMVHDCVAGEAWPWTYRARQDVRLTSNGLTIALTLTNHDTRPMPAGIGLHPYFPADPDARLTFAARHVWLNDATGLPDRTAPPAAVIDWSQGAAVRTPQGLDHLYDGWNGRADFAGPRGEVVLTADAELLQVFQLPGGDFICAEPATQRPNLVNSAPGELTVLSPGASLSLTMTIGAAP